MVTQQPGTNSDSPILGAMKSKHAVVVGSLTRDRIEVSGKIYWRVGGVVWHAGTTLVRLGFRTRAVTRTAADDEGLVEALRDNGLQVHWRPATATTTFVNKYSQNEPDHRTQEVSSVAEPIEKEDIRRFVRDVDLAYFGPLHPSDIAEEALEILRIHRPATIALDIQGYTRTIHGTRVVLQRDRRLWEALSVCDVVKASHEEAEIVTGSSDPSVASLKLAMFNERLEVVVTCGRRGVYISHDGRTHHEPALVVDVDDTTGAGDIYFSSYLSGRLGNASIREAARFAASFTAQRLADPSRIARL